MRTGLEVEYGVATGIWCREPVDEGTRQVAENGFQVNFDKAAVFEPFQKLLNR